MKLQKFQTKLLPVESEHNAIFQCINYENLKTIKELILTASGGPFRTLSLTEMENVTVNKQIIPLGIWVKEYQ